LMRDCNWPQRDGKKRRGKKTGGGQKPLQHSSPGYTLSEREDEATSREVLTVKTKGGVMSELEASCTGGGVVTLLFL